MSRYIDAEKLKSDMMEAIFQGYTEEDMLGIVNEQDTADVVEVKHGHWAHVFGGFVECSNCGDPPLLDGEREYVESEYCPWCGALMDGVTE